MLRYMQANTAQRQLRPARLAAKNGVYGSNPSQRTAAGGRGRRLQAAVGGEADADGARAGGAARPGVRVPWLGGLGGCQ
jgi:hypothetical protein